MFTGQQIANIALADVGHAYALGGIPGTNGKNPWDCSSAVDWWLGKKCGFLLPGMTTAYTGASHGPVVISYVTWRSAETVLHPQAGDLVMWPGIGANGHIGIAVSETEMVSALNPAMGTQKTLISATHPGIPMIRRIKDTVKTAPGGGVTTTGFTDPFTVLTNANAFAGDLLSADLWERIGMSVAGAVLIIVGLLIVGRSNGNEETVESVTGFNKGRRAHASGREPNPAPIHE